MKHLYDKIFSSKNKETHKIITIFGFKIKFKINSEILLSKNFQRLHEASVVNQEAFKQYKGIFRGKDIVMIGAGPTVKDFIPIDSAIYVGCNRAFLLKNVDFDFLFAIDKVGIEDYYNEFFTYRQDKCIKFIGDQKLGKDYQIPEDVIPMRNTIHRYVTNCGIEYSFPNFQMNIAHYPLINSTSVTIQAMQFILWTQPKRIYIVGVDCTCATNKHFVGADANPLFRSENYATNDKISIVSYKAIKEFAQIYYPKTEIISINPVGLRGIFKDIYTKSYINKNPNLAKELGHNLTYFEGSKGVITR